MNFIRNIVVYLRSVLTLYPNERMHMSYIRPTSNGFVLLADTGALIGTYTRARDARRGAARRGLVVA